MKDIAAAGVQPIAKARKRWSLAFGETDDGAEPPSH
jgi:hypothetical protein